MCTGLHTPSHKLPGLGVDSTREDCKPGQKEGSQMIDVILGLVLLLGSLSNGGSQPPAGGVPIPQSGVNSAQ